MERGQAILNYSGYILRRGGSETASKCLSWCIPEINAAAPSVWLQAVFRRVLRRYYLNVAMAIPEA